MIGQHFALLYPDRLQALVLCSTGAQTNEAGKKIFEERIARVNEGGIETQVEGSIGSWFTPQFVSRQPATVEWVRTLYRKTSPAGFITGSQPIQGLDTLDRLSRIAAPTLLIPGHLAPALPNTLPPPIQSNINNP